VGRGPRSDALEPRNVTSATVGHGSTIPQRWARCPPRFAWKRPGLPTDWVRVLDRHPEDVEALQGFVWLDTAGKPRHVAAHEVEFSEREAQSLMDVRPKAATEDYDHEPANCAACPHRGNRPAPCVSPLRLRFGREAIVCPGAAGVCGTC
jgi:hypothetical protein